MRLLITILLIPFLSRAQSIDSILTARFAKMLSDSMKVNQVVLDSGQFEIIKGVVRIKNQPVPVVPVLTGVNLLTYSDQFDNPIWEKANGATVLPDQIVGVDSAKSGDLFSVSPTTWGNLLRRSYVFANQKYTQTVYLKRNNWDFVGIRIANAIKTSYVPFVNLSTLEVNNQSIPGCVITAEQLAGGIVKVNLTLITTAGTSYYDIAVTDSKGNSAYKPAGTEKVYVLEAELRPGDAGKFTKTTNVAVQ